MSNSFNILSTIKYLRPNLGLRSLLSEHISKIEVVERRCAQHFLSCLDAKMPKVYPKAKVAERRYMFYGQTLV